MWCTTIWRTTSRITLDLYAQAGMMEKREAQRKVVEMVLRKGKALT